MRKTKFTDFTGGDAIKLAIVLYAVKELYLGIDAVMTPKLRRWSANLEEKTRIRKAEETLRERSP